MFAFLTTIARFIWSFRSTAAQERSLLLTIVTATQYRIPLADAVSALAYDETGYHAYRVAKLAELLRNGDSLRTALEKVPRAMSESSRTQILFGIESGELETATRNAIVTLDDRPHESLHYCFESLTRMAITVWFMAFVISFIMIKIVPTLKAIFDDFELDINRSMDWCIQFANFIASYAPLLLLAALIAVLWIWFGDPVRFLKRGLFSRWISRFIDLDAADLLRQLAIAKETGKPLSGALSTLARCYHAPAGRQQLLRAWSDVERGNDTWSALEKEKLITNNEADVIRASETLDNTPWALRQLANQRQAKSSARFRVFSNLLPTFVLFPIAAIVALLAIGMMGTLTKLILALS